MGSSELSFMEEKLKLLDVSDVADWLGAEVGGNDGCRCEGVADLRAC